MLGEGDARVPIFAVDFNIGVFLTGVAVIAVGKILQEATALKEDVDYTV